MSYEDIVCTTTEGITTISINRPERRNSMRRQTMQELALALREADGDPTCRVVIVTGSGDRAFCAGAEVDDFRGKDITGTRQVYDAFLDLSRTIRSLGKPTIAAVNGYALGGGCALSMLLDLTIAVESARFGLPEVKLGIFPMTVMPILFRTVGRKKALEMIYTGELLGAAEAERIGLVNAVTSPEEFQSTVQEWADRLRALSPSTFQLGHAATTAMADMTYDQALEYGRSIGAIVILSDDAQEGVSAFLEKRKPSWGVP
jgi:enoyl-CoA hydratase/carnithine racemase